MIAQVYHFPLLNHIRHNERIDFPFYLLSSLQINIEKGVGPPLHQGLMLSIYKPTLAFNPHGNPLVTRLDNENRNAGNENCNAGENAKPLEEANPIKEHNPKLPLFFVVRNELTATKSPSPATKSSNPSTPMDLKNPAKRFLELELVKVNLEKCKHSPLLLELPKSKKMKKESKMQSEVITISEENEGMQTEDLKDRK